MILIVSLLLTAGFVATSLASYYASRASLRSQITKRELPLTSDNIYSEIQRDLLRPIFISSLMANDTFLRDWVIGGEKDEQQVIRYLDEIQKKYNAFTSFFVSEQTRTYYHAKGILKKVTPGAPRDQWYFRVRSMTPDYEINVDPDLANKDSMTIFINYRVFDYDHHFIGATGVGLRVIAVKALIKKYQENYDRSICFIDKKGSIALHGSNLPETIKHVSDVEGLSSVAPDILSKKGSYFTYKRKGKIVHLNTRYIPEFDWYLLVEQTEEKATRQILHTLLINMGVCAVITLIVLFLTNMTISAFQSRLEKMATIDKLTGIYNRQAFDIIIQQILKDIQRKRADLSVLLFDIDYFKTINDDFGHLAGDAVIQHIVAITRGIVRDSDILCRWGGEEFLILLQDCGLTDAHQLSEKIRKTVRQTPAVYKGMKISSTISFGVTRYHSFETADSLLSRLDALLYKAKQKGRDRSEIEREG